MPGEPPASPARFELPDTLASYLEGGTPRLLILAGPPGAGKSSFLRELVGSIKGPKALLLYQQPMAPTAGGQMRAQVGGATTVLLGDLRTETDREGAPEAPGPRPPAGATGVYAAASGPMVDVVTGMERAGGGTFLVDSWDRESERYLRALLPPGREARQFSLPAAEFGELQSTLLSLKIGLALAVVPELALPLQSLADGVVEFRHEERRGAMVRLISVPKLRGSSRRNRELLYTLDGGNFRAFDDQAGNSREGGSAPEPDPGPSEGTIWPGSAAFAERFGRLKYGALTAVALTPDCPDMAAISLAEPLVAHVLRSGGRVVWMPAPSIRPSKLLAGLRDHVPGDWLRERLRVVTPAGTDPSLGELASVVLPLRREMGQGGDVRAATSPGVTPIFPEAHQFLRRAPENAAALYVMSVEGLRASSATVGVTLNPATLPAILAAYARLPRFHGFGYGQIDDPLVPALLPMVETLLQLQMIGGRAVLHGQRPRTGAYVLDWPPGSPSYTLPACH